MKEMDFPTYTVNKNIDEIRKIFREPYLLKDVIQIPPDKKVNFMDNEVEVFDEALGIIKIKIEEISDNSFRLKPEIPSMPDRSFALNVSLSMIHTDKTLISMTFEHDVPFFFVPILKITLKEIFSRFFEQLNKE
ncbi:MAG: hypothetical protein N2Z72_08645 [Bacteroidales bacterium]|nr:hypothetical protein [Bacteroidales bacterium]